MESCEQAGLKKPVWNTKDNSVTLTFFGGVRHSKPTSNSSEGAAEGTNEGAIEGVIECISQELKKGRTLMKQGLERCC